MKRSLLALLALVILIIPATGAAAPPRPGAYAAGFLGITLPVDTDAASTQYGPGIKSYNDRVEYDASLNIGGSGGYDFGFLRIEGEVAYKNGEMSSITERTSNTKYANVDGRVGVYSLLCNAFLDLRNPSPFTPYIGGGIGFATLYLDDTFGTNTSTGFRNTVYESDEDTVFAYQVGAGLEISVTPHFSLDLGYRYFGTAKADFNRNSSLATEMKFESHNASIGFRVKF